MIQNFYAIIMYICKTNFKLLFRNQFQNYAFSCNTSIVHCSFCTSKKNSHTMLIIWIYALQNLHGQFAGFPFFTLFLKTCKDKALFNSYGSRGQILAPKFDAVFVPNNIVLKFLEVRRIPLLMLQLLFS